MSELDRPRLEGSVAVRDGRRLSFAEFGNPRGAAIVWMHGTPGARRQIPVEAGRSPRSTTCGSSASTARASGPRPRTSTATSSTGPATSSRCATSSTSTRCRVIGLSGGGPYALAAGAAMPDRVHGVGVLGGVAPTQGPDAISERPDRRSRRTPHRCCPSRGCRSGSCSRAAIRLVRPFAGPFLDSYAAVQPRGDKELLARPEFRAMFLDDLLNGVRVRTSARCSPTSSCSPATGASRRPTSQVPVHWWHGDSDHIVPHAHGVHMAERLPARDVHHHRRRVPPRRPGRGHRGARPS